VSQGWPGGWEAWAAQEPENAHSHLLSLMLGNSETVPISKGELKTGVWQVGGTPARDPVAAADVG
jgi:hypothetical protein